MADGERQLRDALAEKDSEVRSLQNENRRLLSDLQARERELAATNQEKSRANEKAQTREAELQSLKSRMKREEEEQKNLLAVKSQMESQVRQLERELRSKGSEQQLNLTYRVEELENEKAQLERSYKELKEETKTLYRIQHMKTRAIEQMHSEIRESSDVKEKQKEMEIALRSLRVLVPDQEKMIEQLKVIQAQKDEEIQKLLQESREDKALQALQTDKKILENELKRSQELRSQQERTIRAQQIRIERLLQRLEVLASCAHPTRGGSRKGKRAVGADGAGSSSGAGGEEGADVDVEGISEETVRAEEAEESVPVALYNQLQEEVLYLQSLVREKEGLITEKDAAVEHLDRKLSIISKAKTSDARVAHNAYKELEAEYDALREELTTKEQKFKDLESSLRKELYSARSKLRGVNAGGPANPSPVRQAAPAQAGPSSGMADGGSGGGPAYMKATASSSSRAQV